MHAVPCARSAGCSPASSASAREAVDEARRRRPRRCRRRSRAARRPATQRWCSRQSMSQPLRRPVAGRSRPGSARGAGWDVGHAAITWHRAAIARSPSTSTRPCTTTGTALADAAKRPLRGRAALRGAVRLWGITRLEPEQLQVVRRRDPLRRDDRWRPSPTRARSRPSRLARRRPLHPRHQPPRRARHAATARWLERIGLPYDDLHCSYDKVSRCVELGIDVLIDDSPVNLAPRAERGIVAATIVHPWNADLCERGGRDLRRGLARAGATLEPLLGGASATRRLTWQTAPPMARTAHRRSAASASPREREDLRDHLPGDRARAPGQRLGPLGARRGPARPHGRRLLLPLLVPLRGRGHRERPRRRRRAAGLQPLRRAAARRGDDRQGDQGGAPAPAAAAPHRRALLQGLSRASRCCSRRSAASPRTRPTSTACSTTSSSSCSSSPRAARAPRSSTRTATGCAASAAAASSRPRCAPRAPIVPVAVVGAEEAAPIFAQITPLQRLTGLLYFPITPTFPHLGPARDARLPARRSSRSASSSRSHRRPGRRAVGGQGARADGRPRDPRARSRRSCSTWSASAVGLVRMSESRRAPRPHHRPLHLLGRPAGAGARARPGDRGDHRRRPRGRRRSSSSAPSSSQVADPALADPPHRRRPPRSTRSSTRAWSSTRSSTSPRRAHENNVIGTMNILAACSGPDSPVRKFVFKSSAHYYGCEQDDPAFFTEDDARARTRRARRSSATSSRPRRPSRTSPTSNPDVDGHACCASPTALGPDAAHLAHALLRAAGRRRRSSASTRATSSSTRTTSSARSSTRSATTSPGIYNAAGRRRARAVEVADLLGKPLAPVLPPWGTGLAAAGLRRAGLRIPAEMLQPAALRPRRRQPQAQGHRLPLPLHHARDRACKLREHQRLRAAPAQAQRRALPLRARGRGVPALEPERARRDRPAEPVKNVAPGGRARRASAHGRAGRGCRARSPQPTTTSSRPRRSSRCCATSTPRTSRRLREHEEAPRGREPVLARSTALLALPPDRPA